MKKDRLSVLLEEYLIHKNPTAIKQLFASTSNAQEQTQAVAAPRALSVAPVENAADATVNMDIHTTFEPPFPQPNTVTIENTCYEIQKQLGEGGMGTVWQVRETTLNRHVAMKVIHSDLNEKQNQKENFIEEAEINAQLQHPGIVPIYSLGTNKDGKLYFTMREIEGRTFKKVIQTVHDASDNFRWRTTNDNWNIRKLLYTFHKVCETISYAHSMGVIHQDIKPSNIMIGGFGEVLVVDWGVAKVYAGNSGNGIQVETRRSREGIDPHAGMIVGTPTYMSPEQATGNSHLVDERSDVYSLGAMLYQILSGHNAYQGSIQSILANKANQYSSISRTLDQQEEFPYLEPPPLHDQTNGPPIPNSLIVICEKAMKKNPDERYQSAEELANQVQKWLDGAERKEKAQEILDKVAKLEDTIAKIKIESKQSWRIADQLITKQGFSSEDAWNFWQNANDLKTQSAELEDEIEQLLQGVLIYDPEMTEVHRRLTRIVYREYMKANLQGNRDHQSRIARRIRVHLEMLPPSEAQYWRVKRETDLRSLNVERKRGGVFFNRHNKKDEILAALKDFRIISLVGVRGSGKTHLALETAIEWRNQKECETIFCSLRQAHNRTEIASAIIKSIGDSIDDTDITQQLLNKLKSKGTFLLVLDNIDHIAEQIDKLVHSLIKENPHLHLILTTSIPTSVGKTIRVGAMSTLEAMEFFMEKARRHLPELQFTVENRQHIATIVNCLDRLPLAIEITAARVSSLPLPTMSQRFLENATPSQSSPKSLQKTLIWSWELLNEWEKVALAQCFYFQNGFDLEAAEAIIDVTAWADAPTTIDILEKLCSHKLLIRERQQTGTIRYTSSIHEELPKVQVSNRMVQTLPLRHAQYYGNTFLQYTEQSDENLKIFLEEEHANLIAGMNSGSPENAFLCSIGVFKFFKQNGPASLGVTHLKTFLHRSDLESTTRIQVQINIAKLLDTAGKTKEAKQTLETALRQTELNDTHPEKNHLPQKQDTPVLSAEEKESYHQEATAHYQAAIKNDDVNEKLNHFNKALELFQKLDEGDEIEKTMRQIGHCYQLQFQYDTAIQYFYASTDHLRRKNARDDLENVLLHIGGLYKTQGKYKKALRIYNRAKNTAIGLNDILRQARATLHIANLLLERAQYDEALQAYQQTVSLYQSINNENGFLIATSNMGLVYANQGDQHKAIKQFQIAINGFEKRKNIFHKAVHLGNSGDSYYLLQQYDQAEKQFKECLEILQQCNKKVAHGVFSASLALVYAHQGERQRALQMIKDAEPAVKTRPEEYMKLLCKKGEILLLAGKKNEASVALYQAQTIANHLHVVKGSGLRTKIMTLKAQTGSQNLHLRKTPEHLRADIYIEQGKQKNTLSKYDEATVLLNDAIEIYKKYNNHNGHILGLVHLARNSFNRSDFQKALQIQHQAIHLQETQETNFHKDKLLLWLALIHSKTNEHNKAITLYKQMIQIAEDRGDKNNQGQYLGNLANIYRVQGKYEQSRRYYETAIALLKTIENKSGVSIFSGNMGNVYKALGQIDKAIDSYNEAIFYAQNSGNKRDEGLFSTNLGNALREQEKWDEAVRTYKKALTIQQQIEDKYHEGITFGNLGITYYKMGLFDKAEVVLQTSIAMCKNLPFPLGVAVFSTYIALITAEQGNAETGLEILQQHEATIQKSPMEHLQFECARGKILVLLKRHSAAKLALDKAQEMAEAMSISNNAGVRNSIIELQKCIAKTQQRKP